MLIKYLAKKILKLSFTHIITFISLIYGLALAHSLSCIAGYIQNWKEIKQYWVWWFWALFLILLSVGFWISIYSFYNDIEDWNVFYFFFLTLQSSLFYLTYYIFFNHFEELKDNNLELEYYRYKKQYFILLAIQFILMFFGNNFLLTEKSALAIFKLNVPIFFYSIILFFLAFNNNKILHKIFASLFLILFITTIILDSI